MLRLIVSALMCLVWQAPDYRVQVENYRKGRESRINAATGATALVGLHWLSPGEHSVGREISNRIVLTGPSAPAKLGNLIVSANRAALKVAPGITARVGNVVSNTIDFDPEKNTEANVGGMTFTVIKRAKGLALRVWDTNAPKRLAFRGLTWFPVDAAWNINAAWVPHTPAPVVHVLDVVGQVVDMPNPGAAVFTIGGKEYRLEALVDPDNPDALFFPFRDATSNKTTYGAGRYFYVNMPKDGRVRLDFNYALNPPCAFSDFTTCPVAPASNRLTLAITAGEQYKR